MNILGILSFILCVGRAACCQLSFFKSSTDSVSCCQYCDAGFFMTKECDGSTETQCQACASKYFTTAPNNLLSCKPCRKECGGGKIIVTECNSTSDIQCECPPGRYWDTMLLKCSECTKCGPGQRMVSPCEKEKNGKCETCAKGTYLDNNGECLPCRRCRKGETVMEECLPSQNTVCRTFTQAPKTDLRNSSEKVQTIPAIKPTTLQQKGDTVVMPGEVAKEGKWTTITWILLCFVIVLTAILVFLLLRLLWRKTRRQGLSLRNDKKKDLVSTQERELPIKENNKMFRSVPANITEKLGRLLNSRSGNNWRHLAGLMGYSSTDTQYWNVTPEEATQKLLYEWSQKNGSTVYALYNFLKKLPRDDAASVLLPFLVDQTSGGANV